MITLSNKESENPKPINPDEPIVITYGKKFVKTDNEAEPERLMGAEFVVTNADGTEFLALKDQTQDMEAYKLAQEAYLTAIDEYNKLPEEERTQAMLENIARLKVVRDEAYVAMNTQWEWVTDQTQAFIFVSGLNGQLEVTGLAPGTYNLKEIKAPAGFILNENLIEFTVGVGSYSTGNIPYQLTDEANAQQVKNTNVTIPQTGGIGTVIFGVVGATLMGGAVIAFKKSEEDEE